MSQQEAYILFRMQFPTLVKLNFFHIAHITLSLCYSIISPNEYIGIYYTTLQQAYSNT
jgi:hypothetical protein